MPGLPGPRAAGWALLRGRRFLDRAGATRPRPDRSPSLTPGLHDFLFHGIGEPGGTRVFRRTFSALLLDSIVVRASAAGDPDPDLLETIAAAMERYASEERDLRGFVPPYGWAHSVAHGADVLASLMESSVLRNWSARLLTSVQTLLCRSRGVYAHQEDKRLARVVAAHGLHHPDRRTELLAWLDGLLEACPPSFTDMERYAGRTNLLNLLRALYFYLHTGRGDAGLASHVEGLVRTLMRITPA
jgi:hypothetical protein